MTNATRHGEAGNDTSLVTISYKSCNTSKTRLSVYVEELYRYTLPDTLNQLTIEAGGIKRKYKYHRHHFLS
ncbi:MULTISPECIES: hypothetical protein [Bacillus cereus group]|uniref:Uncharacterized protein n=1 Tax=Bacillus thuringiensis subsp. finitimus TaxID=29337 RepID=A0A243GSD7_BACTF|nr:MULTISPECIES: hypothetical protein [Bacillus cereus group]OUA10540.1 hypothetical protein BK772_07085 [Bacillus thuringiensis serovar finitimus]